MTEPDQPPAPRRPFDTSALGNTERIIHQYRNDVSELWERLDHRLRGWLIDRAQSASLPPDTTAEDLVQDVLFLANRNLDVFEVGPDASFRGWLLTLLQRRRIDLWRGFKSEKRGGGKVARIDTRLGACISDETYEEEQLAQEDREEWQLVREAMESLPAAEREILEVYALSDLSSQEVAAQLGLRTSSAVRVRANRAKKRLRAELDRLRGERGGGPQ